MPDSTLTERDLTEGYWQSYVKWNIDARETKRQDLSTATANLAVQGIGSDSPIYQATMNRLTEEFDLDVSGIESGQTRQNLERFQASSNEDYFSFLNRQGQYEDRTDRPRNRGYKVAAAFEGATEEENKLVAALDVAEGNLGKGVGSTRNKQNEATQAIYDGLSAQRDALIDTRKNQSLEDFYTNEFGLNTTDETKDIAPQANTTNNRQRFAGSTNQQAGPWWE